MAVLTAESFRRHNAESPHEETLALQKQAELQAQERSEMKEEIRQLKERNYEQTLELARAEDSLRQARREHEREQDELARALAQAREEGERLKREGSEQLSAIGQFQGSLRDCEDRCRGLAEHAQEFEVLQAELERTAEGLNGYKCKLEESTLQLENKKKELGKEQERVKKAGQLLA